MLLPKASPIYCLILCSHVFASVDITPENDPQTSATHTLSWATESGQQYLLEESTNLDDWSTPDGFPSVASGKDMLWPIEVSSGSSAFYRVNMLEGQAFNLPLPEDGTRYDSQSEIDGPKWPSNYGEGHVTLWHDGKFSAYSITIDDNNSPDFPFWLDVSETYGWKLTWFVIVHPYVWDIYNEVEGSNTGYFGTLDEWKTLQDLGHDIQLHGACSAMNDLTEADYEDHIVRSINVLENGTGSDVMTFAYPCGGLTSNDGTQDYYEIITRYMIGSRGTSGGVTPVHLIDYQNTKSLGVNRLSDGEPNTLFSRYDDARSFLYSQYRGWCVTLYHGIGSGQADIIETLDWVKAHEDEFWVAPFTDVTKYAQERETATLEITLVEEDTIEFEITDGMDDSIYDHPLTIKLRLDSSWDAVDANQDGQPIESYIVYHEGNVYAYVQPIPDRGAVTVNRIIIP
jgi:peptidoglycan/xylan/chitin deacetylase (PgdA/CDA1 family)